MYQLLPPQVTLVTLGPLWLVYKLGGLVCRGDHQHHNILIGQTLGFSHYDLEVDQLL